jgi:hypothetical protein
MSELVQPTRRGLIRGLGLLVAAPAIVRVANIMPVRAEQLWLRSWPAPAEQLWLPEQLWLQSWPVRAVWSDPIEIVVEYSEDGTASKTNALTSSPPFTAGIFGGSARPNGSLCGAGSKARGGRVSPTASTGLVVAWN